MNTDEYQCCLCDVSKSNYSLKERNFRLRRIRRDAWETILCREVRNRIKRNSKWTREPKYSTTLQAKIKIKVNKIRYKNPPQSEKFPNQLSKNRCTVTPKSKLKQDLYLSLFQFELNETDAVLCGKSLKCVNHKLASLKAIDDLHV